MCTCRYSRNLKNYFILVTSLICRMVDAMNFTSLEDLTRDSKPLCSSERSAVFTALPFPECPVSGKQCNLNVRHIQGRQPHRILTNNSLAS